VLLYLHAEIDIFGGRIGRLRHAVGGAIGKIRGILNHRDLALRSGRILGDQSDVGKSVASQCGRDELEGPGGVLSSMREAKVPCPRPR